MPGQFFLGSKSSGWPNVPVLIQSSHPTPVFVRRSSRRTLFMCCGQADSCGHSTKTNVAWAIGLAMVNLHTKTEFRPGLPTQRAVSPRSTREADRHDLRFRDSVCVHTQLYTHMCTHALRRDEKPRTYCSTAVVLQLYPNTNF